MDGAGQGCLLNSTVRKRHLTELVFCVEYSLKAKSCLTSCSVMEGSKKMHLLLPPYTYGESMKTNADCEDGGSTDKSVDR